MSGIRACVFDAYGTLFDVNAAARVVAGQPGKEAFSLVWQQVSTDWRLKVLQYTWLRTISGHYVDFWRITEDALDWALEASDQVDPDLRSELLGLFWSLSAYPEVKRMLEALKSMDVSTAILSNGTKRMLAAAVDSADIGDCLDAVLSVEDLQVYKPTRSVYDMVGEEFGLVPSEVMFVSSNGWECRRRGGLWLPHVVGQPRGRADGPVAGHAGPGRPRSVGHPCSGSGRPFMRFVTAADGTRLHYDDRGQGVSVLCLPGLTRNMDDFQPVVDAFASRARIIRMDFRGRGGSDYADPATYSVPQEAADVVALLDHLGLEKVAILGTSRGGLVAMMLAVTARDRLAGVFLNDVGPEVDPAGLANIMSYIGNPLPFKSYSEGCGRHAGRLPNVSERAGEDLGRPGPASLG